MYYYFYTLINSCNANWNIRIYLYFNVLLMYSVVYPTQPYIIVCIQ